MQRPAPLPQHPARPAKSPAHACLIGTDLSAVLRLARAGLKWRQADFAKIAKVSIRTIQMIEANDLDPRASTLRKIADVLHHHGVSVWRDDTGAICVTIAQDQSNIVPIEGRQRAAR